MTDREKVIEGLAKWLREHQLHDISESWDTAARQMLADNPGLAVVDRNAGLPENPVVDWIDINPRVVWKKAQQDIRKAGYVKELVE